MRVLVFGKTGQVARALGRQHAVTALGRDQADLSDPRGCADAVVAHGADVVINAAAYTAVDAAETDQTAANLINADTPGAMARACADMGLPFLHISTDYVFDGAGTEARRPDARCAPINAYGRSKLLGEQAVTDAGGRHAILRTSWVFSAQGANFVKSMLRLGRERAALSIVEDQIGGPTPADAIAAALLTMARAMADGHSGGTYHLSGAPDTSWAGFAREIFRVAGMDTEVTGIPTRDYPTPAKRPLNSRLDCHSLKSDFGIPRPDWQAHLEGVVKELNQ